SGSRRSGWRTTISTSTRSSSPRRSCASRNDNKERPGRMPEDVVRIEDGFYILSTSSRVDDRTCVLKQGDVFAIFDRFGDVESLGSGALGIYHHDTRFLSKLALKIADERPLFLSSTIKEDNAVLAVDLMNPDIPHANDVTIPRGSVHVFRSKVLWDTACHERLRIHNYG